MITIIRKESTRTSYTRKPLREVAEMLRRGSLQGDYRTRFSLCFATEMLRQNGALQIRELNGLCLLQVLNLPGPSEVGQARTLAGNVPFTCLTFGGDDGRSLYIVARYGWKETTEAMTEERMRRLHSNAYKQLHYTYSVQLRMSIDTLEPTLDQACPASKGRDVRFTPNCQVFAVGEEEVNVPVFEIPATGRLTNPSELFNSQMEADRAQFQWAYSKALAEARTLVTSQKELEEACLELLAGYCHEMGLDMEMCIRQTTWKQCYWERRDYVRLVFRNAYDQTLSQFIPFGHVESSALLMMRLEAYLNARYLLRRNTLTGVVEYRDRHNYCYGYRPLTEQDMNSMTTGALKMGLPSWDKDLRRIVNSSDIPLYDPLEDYLLHLPKWDGHDHVADLCARIPSDTPHHALYLHRWLLSMVAHWMGKDRLHGNALVPLLIGGQGCGKTSFCNILLPNELRIYYNDKIDFRSEGDIMSALSNYALINIDEFDSLKRSQQPLLKYLLSKSEVRFRPPYGKAIVERRRYASFIATTNLGRPLKDPTGSRRFACILIRDGEQIDFATPIRHDQLFAQLLHELNEGERYWLDEEETEQLQQQNRVFQCVDTLPDMIDEVLAVGNEDAGDTWHNLSDISVLLRRRFPTLRPTKSLHRDLGWALTEKAFPSKRITRGTLYLIREK